MYQVSKKKFVSSFPVLINFFLFSHQ